MSSPTRGVVRQIERAMARHTKRSHQVVQTRVLGRNRDGTLQTQRIDGGSCAERGCFGAEPQGAVIARQPRCQSSTGATGATVVTLAGAGGLVIIESIEPDVFERGQLVTVMVHGRGFGERTEIAFGLQEQEDPNPDVAVNETRRISPEALEVDITVAADAAPLQEAPVLYGTESLALRTGPLYGITMPAAPTSRYLVLHATSGDAALYHYAADGTRLGELARGPGCEHYSYIVDTTGRYLGYDGEPQAATTIRTVDPAAGTAHEHAIPAGRIACAPGFAGDRVRWIELDPTSSDSSIIQVDALQAPWELLAPQVFASPVANDQRGAPPGSGVVWQPGVLGPFYAAGTMSVALESLHDLEPVFVRVLATYGGLSDAALFGDPRGSGVGRPIGIGGQSLGPKLTGTILEADVRAGTFGTLQPWPANPGAPGISIAPAADGSFVLLRADSLVDERDPLGELTTTIALDTTGAEGTPVAIFPLY